MKKGSLVVRCSKCGKKLGWLIPKDGKAREEYEEKLDCKVKFIKGDFGTYYWCGCGNELAS